MVKIYEFYKLGLGEPYSLSAMHRKGFEVLNRDIQLFLKTLDRKAVPKTAPRNLVRMAVVGRPNVGKSSFINTLLSEERLLVSEAPGTTRDAVDVHIKRDKEILLITDTAGIRHKK